MRSISSWGKTLCMKRTLIAVVALLFLAPIWVPLLAVLVVVAICVAAYRQLWLLRFCWKHAGNAYLVCSRKRGWESLLQNNVLPVVPDRLVPIWMECPGPHADVVAAARMSNVFLPKPFVLHVTRFRLESAPLNPELRHLKHQAAVSEAARRDARRILEAALDSAAR